MIKMKFSFIFFLIILFLSSCRELVQDEFSDFTPVPTVNSILVADSLLKVHVSLAGKIDTNQLVLVDNAEVLLYVDEQYTETLTYTEQGIYCSSVILGPLKTYRCEVNIPGFQSVKCSTYIPEHAIISNIIHINKAGKDEEGIAYPAITFTFSNKPEEKLFFEVVLTLFRYSYIERADLEAITDQILLNEGLPILLFSNELITEDNYTMTINYNTHSGTEEGMSLYPLVLELRSVSYDYFQFVKQLYLYEKGRYPEFWGGSSTAFPLYSNINGGYGIFAGYSSVQSDTIYP